MEETARNSKNEAPVRELAFKLWELGSIVQPQLFGRYWIWIIFILMAFFSATFQTARVEFSVVHFQHFRDLISKVWMFLRPKLQQALPNDQMALASSDTNLVLWLGRSLKLLQFRQGSWKIWEGLDLVLPIASHAEQLGGQKGADESSFSFVVANGCACHFPS